MFLCSANAMVLSSKRHYLAIEDHFKLRWLKLNWLLIFESRHNCRFEWK